MDFNDIDQLMQKRQGEIKKEKSQLVYAFILIFIGFTLCILLWKNHYPCALCLGIGIIIGIILRYSRFCFGAAFRNPLITGSTKVMRAVILGLIVSTIGFAIIQYGHGPVSSYADIPGAVRPVGIHIMIGALIFGIGMVLSAGCASGVLMRIGEGHKIYLVVLLGFIIGTLLGAKDYGVWYKYLIKNARTIYFPDYLDLRIVAVLQVIILIILYGIALWYEKKKINK